MNDSTNQDNPRLKQILEEATAAAPVAGHTDSGQGDVETVSLREAWLAFEQLIRAADDSLPAMPDFAASIAPRKPRLRRWLGLMAASAAALLLAVGLGWWIRRDGRQGNPEQPVAQTPLPQSESKTASPLPAAKQERPKTAVARAEKATNKQPGSSGTKAPVWDDPLETQIAAVSQQIADVRQNWQHRVDDVDLVQYRIDEVAASLQNDKL